ncbi:MAG: hypothetical protein AAB871_02270 [Patescibacteria group bacterium]
MLTDEDVKKLIQVFVTKDDLKEAIANLATKEDINRLTNSIDGILRRLEILHTEFMSLTNKVNRLEEWIKTVAEKTGVKLSA